MGWLSLSSLYVTHLQHLKRNMICHQDGCHVTCFIISPQEIIAYNYAIIIWLIRKQLPVRDSKRCFVNCWKLKKPPMPHSVIFCTYKNIYIFLWPCPNLKAFPMARDRWSCQVQMDLCQLCLIRSWGRLQNFINADFSFQCINHLSILPTAQEVQRNYQTCLKIIGGRRLDWGDSDAIIGTFFFLTPWYDINKSEFATLRVPPDR